MAILEAECAAMDSVLVELPAVSDCVLDLYTIGPPMNVNNTPIVDCRFLRSLACAASTKQCRIDLSISTLNTEDRLGSLGISYCMER